MADFLKDLKRGKQGEVMVATAFRQMGYPVEDVSNLPLWQARDVDLLLDDKGVERRIEVKTDWRLRDTRNIVLELWSYNRNGHDGWFKYSDATHFAFVDPKEKVAYVCRAGELRQRAQELYYKGTIQSRHLNNCACWLLNVDENEDIFNKLILS